MFQGFYNLTSEIICQNRNMSVISNNIANSSTPGSKSDYYVAGNFKEQMLYRTNEDGTSSVPIGKVSMIRASDETTTNYSQGALSETGGNLDMALDGKGFFAVQTTDGTAYTRNGSFMIDDSGYLALSGVGRVLGTDGNPIQLGSDDISVDSSGNIYSSDGKVNFGKIAVVDFQDYNQLTKQDNGVFTTTAQPIQSDATVMWKYTEQSNADPVEQMTSMMGGERSLQSAAQVLKMYDQLMGKIVSEIGNM